MLYLADLENPAPTTWTDEQQAIFDWFETGQNDLFVRARAGTAKTTTLLEGVVRSDPEWALVAAFNRHIADELRERLQHPRVIPRTLHQIGFGFIRAHAKGKVEVDKRRGYRLARMAWQTLVQEHGMIKSTPEIVKLVKEVASKTKAMRFWADKPQDPMVIMQRFDLGPTSKLIQQGVSEGHIALAALRAMKLAQDLSVEKAQCIDFDDMIYLPLAHNWIYQPYSLVCIDEAQDLSPAQVELAVRVCRDDGRVAVFLDDRQCLYGFMGADIENVERVKEDLNDATELSLTTSFRCPRSVVIEAQKIVPDIRPHDDAPPGVVGEFHVRDLGKYIKPGDVVLSRRNAFLLNVCLQLIIEGKKATIVGRDFEVALRGMFKDFWEKCETEKPSEFLDKVDAWEKREIKNLKADEDAFELDQEAAIRDKAEVMRVLCRDQETIADAYVRLESVFKPTQMAVLCSTVHRYKGRECDRVFVLTESFLDRFYEAKQRPVPLEERNIRYVAITRAKRELYWVDSDWEM